MTPLQKLITDRMAELDLSFRAAAEASGGMVTHGTINQIALGKTKFEGIPNRTLRGIALALDVPYSQVHAAWQASVTVTPGPPEFKLPKKADKLTPKQRKAVLAFVEALLDQQ